MSVGMVEKRRTFVKSLAGLSGLAMGLGGGASAWAI
jgi:hypothetical protein